MIRTDPRPFECAMCPAVVNVESATTTHREAPEMLKAPDGAWLGFVAGDHGPELIAICSQKCLEALLSH